MQGSAYSYVLTRLTSTVICSLTESVSESYYFFSQSLFFVPTSNKIGQHFTLISNHHSEMCKGSRGDFERLWIWIITYCNYKKTKRHLSSLIQVHPAPLSWQDQFTLQFFYFLWFTFDHCITKCCSLVHVSHMCPQWPDIIAHEGDNLKKKKSPSLCSHTEVIGPQVGQQNGQTGFQTICNPVHPVAGSVFLCFCANG